MGDHLVRRRRPPLRQVFRGVRILDERDVVAAREPAVHRAAHAGVGLSTREDETTHAEVGEHPLERGVLERVAVALLDDRLTGDGSELVDELPALAAEHQVVAGVLHLYHRHTLGPRTRDQRTDRGNDVVAMHRLADDVLLDIDDEQRAVGPVLESGHTGRD